MRAVCDTNTVVSALLFADGRLAWLRRAWHDGSVVPIVSADTVKELLRVLAYPKFGLSRGDRDELLGDYLPFAETAGVARTVAPAVPRGPDPTPESAVVQCRDPADQMFLDLALAACADALITGDADLLAVAGTFPVPIIAPADARRRLSPEAHDSQQAAEE
ncbi:MAG: putative toxin-antitoxin system toxin component, PIN family [Thermoleophilia bacterium]|nr:putative toxin-antitoxin system toxin component, PIN family [Thermoleophilia bacterium]